MDFASATAPVLEQRPHLRVTLESDPYGSYQGAGGGLTGWTKHYGGVGPERLRALATDAAGGFVAAGQFGDAPFPTGEGFALARYDANGTALWSRQVTTRAVTVRALTVTPEGNDYYPVLQLAPPSGRLRAGGHGLQHARALRRDDVYTPGLGRPVLLPARAVTRPGGRNACSRCSR